MIFLQTSLKKRLFTIDLEPEKKKMAGNGDFHAFFVQRIIQLKPWEYYCLI